MFEKLKNLTKSLRKDGSEADANISSRRRSIRMIEPVGHIDNLRPESYLYINPDVKNAGLDAHEHYSKYGFYEGRHQAVAMDTVVAVRREKLARVAFRDQPYGDAREDAILDYLPDDLRASFEIPDSPPAAQNDYAGDIIEQIEGNPDDLFLDVGAGFRHTYYDNVVNAEIWPAPSTDVLCVGESLPFANDSFDHVLCLAVLEHTKRPWIAAKEIIRVLKPGGTVRIDWPFLQPVHGYPHHYFNATLKGTVSQFADDCDIISADVLPWQHPIFALAWLVKEWSDGLPEPAKSQFGGLNMDAILTQPTESLLGHAWCAELPKSVQEVISAGTTLIARKR